jgi:hypothetical protein
MTSLQAAAYAAQVFAAVSGTLVARRHAKHIPAAVALVLLAATNILDAPILAALTPYPVEPWQGWHRVLLHLDGALSLADGTILAGLAVAITVSPAWRRRAVALVASVWLLASAVLASLYPSPLVRGASLQRIYFTAALAGLCVATIALVTWLRAAAAEKRSPDSAFLVTLGLVVIDGGILLAPFSPWRLDLFAAPYFGPQLVIMVLFTVLATVQVIAWKLMSSSG